MLPNWEEEEFQAEDSPEDEDDRDNFHLDDF
jgi:hypothetical protein